MFSVYMKLQDVPTFSESLNREMFVFIRVRSSAISVFCIQLRKKSRIGQYYLFNKGCFHMRQMFCFLLFLIIVHVFSLLCFYAFVLLKF